MFDEHIQLELLEVKYSSTVAASINYCELSHCAKNGYSRDGGTYGWIYFQGTEEQRNRVYASALALSGKAVTVYTNADGTTCRINNIQALGL